jgi:hypothetical protein
MKVKNEWPTFEPGKWSPDMNVRVNVGLGTGTRERDLMMLSRVAMEQDKVVAQLGPVNPIVPVSLWINTRKRMASAAGLRDDDLYFADVSDEDFAQWMAEKAQNAPPDPKMVAAQMKAQTDQMKAEGDLQRKAVEVQGKLALKSQEMQMEQQLDAVSLAMGANTAGNTNIRSVDGS